MDIFNVLTLVGGLALFLFGMNVMGEALERRAGSKLKNILERLTANPLKGFLLGLGVTAVIQSSSASTVMVVGFVNSGIMQLRQAIGIIMGANVGTTMTAWLISLTGIEGESLFINLLKPSAFSPVLAAIGIGMYMFSKQEKSKDTGCIFLGFAVLMSGMEAMSGAVAPLKDVPEFTNILLMFSNPLLGVLAGAVLTGIIQSSSASVGILQALSSTGAVTYGSAIPIIMGQNIGTCVTAVLSSVGTNKNARRVAAVHLYFNIIGTVFFLILFYIAKIFISDAFITLPIDEVGIAMVHTIFNVVSTALMLPFTKGLEKLAYMTIKDTGEGEVFQMLDERLFSSPAVAVEQSKKLTENMAEIARDSLITSIRLIDKYSDAEVRDVAKKEDEVDLYEDKIGTYLVKLSSHSMSVQDSHEVSKLLHCIGDFERISDHAMNIVKTAEEINDKKVVFSKEAQHELAVMQNAVTDIVRLSVDVFERNDIELAKKVEPLEQVVDMLKDQLKSRHIERLTRGECTTEMGFIFSDLITNYERVADHCSNIAACIIQIQEDALQVHEYTHGIKEVGNAEFQKVFEDYKKEYVL